MMIFVSKHKVYKFCVNISVHSHSHIQTFLTILYVKSYTDISTQWTVWYFVLNHFLLLTTRYGLYYLDLFNNSSDHKYPIYVMKRNHSSCSSIQFSSIFAYIVSYGLQIYTFWWLVKMFYDFWCKKKHMLEGKCTTSLVHRKDVNFCNNVSKFYSNILHARNFPLHCGFYQKCNSIPILSNRNSIMIHFYIILLYLCG